MLWLPCNKVQGFWPFAANVASFTCFNKKQKKKSKNKQTKNQKTEKTNFNVVCRTTLSKSNLNWFQLTTAILEDVFKYSFMIFPGLRICKLLLSEFNCFHESKKFLWKNSFVI